MACPRPARSTVIFHSFSFILSCATVDLSIAEILSQTFGDNACHPERSEGSVRQYRQILRCAQDDTHYLQMSNTESGGKGVQVAGGTADVEHAMRNGCSTIEGLAITTGQVSEERLSCRGRDG